MKKAKCFWRGMLAAGLVSVMAVLGACYTVPAGAVVVEEPVMPDANSAVVYFVQGNRAGIWDGETPVGEFSKNMEHMVWKTTPGEHYFMANTFNWVQIRADLEANKRYYVQIIKVPNPVPFAQDFVALKVLDPVAGERLVATGSKWALKTLSFTDDWRAGYAQGKRLEEARKELQEARGKQLDIDLSGINGL